MQEIICPRVFDALMLKKLRYSPVSNGCEIRNERRDILTFCENIAWGLLNRPTEETAVTEGH